MGEQIKKIAWACLMGTMLIGCGSQENIDAFIKTDVNHAVVSRVGANKAIAEQLYKAGLMSEKEYNDMAKALDDSAKTYMGDSIADNEKIQSKLFEAIVDWRAPKFNGKEAVRDGKNVVIDQGLTEDEWYNAHVTSYVSKETPSDKLGVPLLKGKGSTITPITLIEPSIGEDLNKRFGYTVHVMKPMNELEGTKSVDDLMARVQSAIKSDGKVDETVLGQLFEKAKDENGKGVTLLDTSKAEYQIVKASSGSALVDKDNMVLGDYTKDRDYGIDISGETNPGKDMILKSATTGIELLALRFIEFDKEAVDRVIAKLGMNSDQYLFVGNNVYIMEYPVYYVSEIKENKENENMYESIFSKSELSINMRTGKLMKNGIYMENEDPYINIAGAKSNGEESHSSFVIIGEIPEGERLKIGDNSVSIRSGMVVLRDYLEGTYAPNVVSGESVVVLGRKMRVKAFSGSKAQIFAEFYDKEGKKIAGLPAVYVSDIADMGTLASSSPKVMHLGGVGEAKGDYSGSSEEGSNIAKVNALTRSVVTSVKPSVAFPSSTIGAVDNIQSSKPLFYAMAVRKDIFESGLFSGWVNNTDTAKNSLGWWQGWLAHVDRRYNYTINHSALENYLVDNYASDLQLDGIVILDLSIIAKIQNEFEVDNRVATVRGFRTAFVIIGWALLVYGMLLLMAWMLDTNVDLGLNILKKLSFGQMTATKDIQLMGDRYVGLGAVFRKAMVVASMGILLIRVNMVDVVGYMVRMFSGLSGMISGLLNGI